MDGQGFLTPDRIIYVTADNPIVGRPRRRDTPALLSDSRFISWTWTANWQDPLAAGGHRRGSKRARVADTGEAVLGLQEVTGRRDECAICLNDFRAEETLRAMPCSHAFHQNCIAEWLRRSAVCPLCRHRLPTAPTATEEEEEDVEAEEEEEENVEEEEEEEEDDGEDGVEWVDGAIGGESC